MSDVEIGDIKYRVSKMSVFDQAHVARKIAPVVFTLGKGYAQAMGQFGSVIGDKAVNGEDPSETLVDPTRVAQENEIMINALAPIADVLSRMEEADVDYVLKKCLAVVARHNGQHYVPVMRSGSLMFDDIDLATLMQLTMEVVQDNLGPSLAALLPLSSAGAAYPSQ